MNPDEHYEGGDIIKRIRNIFTNEYSPKLEQAVKDYGDYEVIRGMIYRSPVQSFVKTALNVLSFGKFKQNVSKNFDDVYHLYMILEMINKEGKYVYLLTEKTPNIQIEKRSSLATGEKNAEGIEVVLPKSVLFKDVIDLAMKENPQGIQKYTADKYNCQQYILSLLNAMYELDDRTVPADLKDFIYQDPMKLFEGLESIAKVSNFITGDLAHTFNRIIGGRHKKY